MNNLSDESKGMKPRPYISVIGEKRMSKNTITFQRDSFKNYRDKETEFNDLLNLLSIPESCQLGIREITVTVDQDDFKTFDTQGNLFFSARK